LATNLRFSPENLPLKKGGSLSSDWWLTLGGIGGSLCSGILIQQNRIKMHCSIFHGKYDIFVCGISIDLPAKKGIIRKLICVINTFLLGIEGNYL